MPDRFNRNTLMFSATFPREIQRLAGDFLNDYIFLAVGRVGSATQNVEQKVIYTRENEKIDKLMEYLNDLKGLTLVFVQTKANANYLERILNENGVEATSIHGDRSQRDREEALDMFKTGRCPVLVATSVAARGLDIPNVRMVINFDCPTHIDDYIHRIGRTGRAGHHGTAVVFVNEDTKIIGEILDTMEESNQEIESWFRKMVSNIRNAKHMHHGRNKKFGGRDYRHNNRRTNKRNNNYNRRNHGNNRYNNNNNNNRNSSYNKSSDGW